MAALLCCSGFVATLSGAMRPPFYTGAQAAAAAFLSCVMSSFIGGRGEKENNWVILFVLFGYNDDDLLIGAGDMCVWTLESASTA